MHAVTGKILRVNLTEGTCTTEAVPDSVYERFLSGIGLRLLSLPAHPAWSESPRAR